jgi:hypothetical protein
MDIVSPQKVVGDYPPGWMNDGDDPLQWEPLVALDV